MHFPIYTRETAPAQSASTIDLFTSAWGFLPNVGGVIAGSPAALEFLWFGYQALGKGSFTQEEQQLLALTISYENQCSYCVAAHSTLALSIGLSPEVVDAIRGDMTIKNQKLEQLKATCSRLVQSRGHLDEDEKQAFFDAGYSAGQLIELVAWVSLKMLTNYINHLAEPELDPSWQDQRWVPQIMKNEY